MKEHSRKYNEKIKRYLGDRIGRSADVGKLDGSIALPGNTACMYVH